jgi:hypothetical protein
VTTKLKEDLHIYKAELEERDRLIRVSLCCLKVEQICFTMFWKHGAASVCFCRFLRLAWGGVDTSSMVGWLVNNELERIFGWKLLWSNWGTIPEFSTKHWDCHKTTPDDCCTGQDSKWVSFEIEIRALTPHYPAHCQFCTFWTLHC